MRAYTRATRDSRTRKSDIHACDNSVIDRSTATDNVRSDRASRSPEVFFCLDGEVRFAFDISRASASQEEALPAPCQNRRANLTFGIRL